MTAGAYLEVLQENPSHKMIWGSFLAQPDQVGFDVSLPVTPVYSMSVGVAGVRCDAGGELAIFGKSASATQQPRLRPPPPHATRTDAHAPQPAPNCCRHVVTAGAHLEVLQ